MARLSRPFQLSLAHSSSTKEPPFLSAEFIVLQCKNEVASTLSASSPGEKGPWQPLGLLVYVEHLRHRSYWYTCQVARSVGKSDVGTVQHDGMGKDLGKSTPLQIVLANIRIHVLGEGVRLT